MREWSQCRTTSIAMGSDLTNTPGNTQNEGLSYLALNRFSFGRHFLNSAWSEYFLVYVLYGFGTKRVEEFWCSENLNFAGGFSLEDIPSLLIDVLLYKEWEPKKIEIFQVDRVRVDWYVFVPGLRLPSNQILPETKTTKKMLFYY